MREENLSIDDALEDIFTKNENKKNIDNQLKINQIKDKKEIETE